MVGSWLLIEVSSTLEETLRLPEWADSLLAMFLLLGFPVALFFSWAYEVTPDGIKAEKDLAADHSVRSSNSRKLDRIIIIMMALALGYFAIDKFIISRPQSAAPGTATAEVSDLSIAVLPFVNMSSDPEQEFFSDGLTEELLNLLAGIDGLKVAARTSSFYYKDKLDDIQFSDVARQLEVAHILEGSVRKSGDRIRITAQLIKADDGFHMWSETYDRELDDIFAIQDEIAAAVTSQLKITLLGDAPKAKVIDTRSWELTQQGRFYFNRRGEGDWERAFDLFKRAVELDPNNATALVGVAPLYFYIT